MAEPTVSEPARTHLERLYVQHGELTTEAVVTAARAVGSPLHRYFEWDDSRAAEAYRHEQAAALIRRVQVRVLLDGDTRPHAVTVRRFEATDEARGAYRAVDDIALDGRALASLLARFERDAAAFERRYGHLEAYTAWVRGQRQAAA